MQATVINRKHASSDCLVIHQLNESIDPPSLMYCSFRHFVQMTNLRSLMQTTLQHVHFFLQACKMFKIPITKPHNAL